MDFDLFAIHSPAAMALAAVAFLGYCFGTLRQRAKTRRVEQDLLRAQSAASELDQVRAVIRSLACVNRAIAGVNPEPARNCEEIRNQFK
jgi:hypothetical protein